MYMKRFCQNFVDSGLNIMPKTKIIFVSVVTVRIQKAKNHRILILVTGFVNNDLFCVPGQHVGGTVATGSGFIAGLLRLHASRHLLLTQ